MRHMAQKPPSVSVITPTFQRRESLRRALRSLTRQTVAHHEYEVIVSIDRSTDGTREMIEALNPPYAIHVAKSAGAGRAAACNAGIELARGEVLILLDDDMEPAPQFIERHRSHHGPASRVCVMGAVPVRTDGGSPMASRYVAAKFAAHSERIAQADHVFVPRDFYSGNASLRAEVLREVGGFNESFGMYGNEDVDLGIRLRAAGAQFRYDGSALAHQNYEKDVRGLARDTRAKGTTTVLLARGHPDVFHALRLADPYDASRPWITARAALLALTRTWRRTSDVVFAAAVVTERLGLWRQPLFYRALLDYAFWVGVDEELQRVPPDGPLVLLATELDRGPLDLLLHR
jgi:GT2 family glycosyltransferase